MIIWVLFCRHSLFNLICDKYWMINLLKSSELKIKIISQCIQTWINPDERFPKLMHVTFSFFSSSSPPRILDHQIQNTIQTPFFITTHSDNKCYYTFKCSYSPSCSPPSFPVAINSKFDSISLSDFAPLWDVVMCVSVKRRYYDM